MKCSICKNDNAIIHIREYSNQGVKKINLCLECALKRGLNAAVENIDTLIGNLVGTIFNNQNLSSRLSIKKGSEVNLVCPSCGKTIQNISNDLELGCPTCYNVFDQIVDLVIFNTNNSLNYLGKLPEDLKEVKIQKTKLKKLKKELKEHIDLEEFAKAANVRDEIKEIKKDIQERIKKIADKK